MGIENLKKHLIIENGKLIINENTIPENPLKDFIEFFNNKAPLVIEQAEEVLDNTVIIVKGKANFMNILLPITVRFEVDLADKPIINLEFNPDAESPLSLKNFMNQYFPIFSEIPEFNTCLLRFNKGVNSSLNVTAEFAEEPVWTIELGVAHLTIRNINLQLNQTPEGFIGAIKGSTEIDKDFSLNIVYKLPGEFLLQVDYPSVNLASLLEKICGNQFSLPEGFKVTLPSSHAMIKFNDGTPSFHSVTEVDGLGLLILSIFKQVEWKTTLVWDLKVPSLSSIPGLEVIKPFQSLVNIKQMVMCIISAELDLADLSKTAKELATQFGHQNFSLPSHHQILESGMSILTGPSVINSEPLQLLLNYLNLTNNFGNEFTISVGLPDPSVDSKIFLPFSSQIQEGTTIEGKLGGLLRGNATQAFLAATIHTQIQGQPIQVDVEADVQPNGILISGTYKGTVNFDPLPIQLSNLSLVIGLSGQGIPSFGFSGNIDIKDWESSIALFFNSTQPSQSMIAGSVSSLTLNDIVRLFVGDPLPDSLGQVLGAVGLKGISTFKMPTSLVEVLKNRDYQALSDAFNANGGIVLPRVNNEILLVEVVENSHWAITNLNNMTHYSIFLRNESLEVEIQPQLYCAPQETFIGSFKFPQGFHLEAKMDHLFFKTQVRIEAEPKKGIAGKAEIDPIIIFNPDFFSITGEDGRGARLSFSTFPKVNETEEGLRDPHFLLIGNIHILGLDILETHILINTDGISFKAVAEPFIHQLDWTARLNKDTNFSSEGNLVVGIKQTLDAGSLGKTNIDLLVNVSVQASLLNQLPSVTCKGNFEFVGIKCTIPPFELSTDGKALLNLADSLWSYMKDILIMLFKNADYWLKMLRDGIIKEVEQLPEQIGKLLSEVHQISAADIASKTKEILEYGPEQISGALKGAGVNPNDIVPILQNFNIPVEVIQSTLKNVFAGTHVDTSCCHIDTPPGPHVDIPESHQDIPEVHLDKNTHIDISGQHIDTGSGRLHIDKIITPHVDKNEHTDTIITPRVSNTTPHIDNVPPPHGDTKTHVDTGGG
ncbi:hypothetical protein COC69_11705 [Bacillus cereus]|uniref:Uncharacterized protein n=1 Tax=Bacillus cereus TaxID=1396 RepID=A0A9X7CP17_BACCE|nr:hypothetical protein [Bacillus cereus]PGS79631.1 hypothetical protein COC69_11705 [Bacillus cereus]